MTQSRSADEIRENCISVLGVDLGKLHYALWNEIAWLHIKWAQYVELFGTSPQRLELLNCAAPLFFRIAQDTLWEDTILHLTRVTDPTESMGKSNLTIRRYPQLVADETLREKLEIAVNGSVLLTDFARDWRNRHLAHRDLHLAFRDPTTPLAPASRASMKAALKSLVIVYNVVERHFFDSTTFFDSLGDPGNAVSLLQLLREGTAARRSRIERLQRGEFAEDDLHPAPLV